MNCNCGHPLDDHDPTNGRCRICGCERGDVLPVDGERLTFGRHRIRDIDAVTAPAWSATPPTLEQRRRDIDRVLRRRK